MSTGTTDDFRAQFMEDKCHYDSLSQAIKLAKSNGCDDKQIKPLVQEKQSYKEKCASNVDKLLKRMSLSQNVLNLGNGWHAVRYVNDKGDIALKVDILNEKDLYLIQRDGRHERELKRNDIDTLIPGMLNEGQIELYKQVLQVRAAELVYQLINVSIDIDIDEIPLEHKVITVSAHAGMRWAQRKLGIKNEGQAEEYRRTHLKEVNDTILEGFNTAEKVWTGEDSIEYWFDADNIMYVVGNQNIITLYEEDFGFTKEINRMITLKQLEVLRESYDNLLRSEDEYEDNVQGTQDSIQTITDEIKVLESKIDMLVAEKASIMSVRDQANKSLRLQRDLYSAEFNKLFKKWDI